MKQLNLKNVRRSIEFGNVLHKAGIISVLIILIGYIFNFSEFTTSPQTLFLSSILLFISIYLPYYRLCRVGSFIAALIASYIIASFFTDISYQIDSLLYIGAESHPITSDATKIMLLAICFGIISKPYDFKSFRSIVLFVSSFLPFNIFIAYLMGNTYITEGTGFWTIMILGFTAWGTLLKQANQRHIRYFIADEQVLRISLILISTVIVSVQALILGAPLLIEEVKNLPGWWPIAPMTVEWLILGSIIIAMARVSHLSNQNRRLIKEKHILATSDKLTETKNRIGFNEVIEKRNPTNKAAIILCDIDRFKAVNDNYGHDTGDMILREFADVLRKNSRHDDTIVRWGGEEFLILSENADYNGIQEYAERLRKSVEDLDVYPKITASFGLAILEENNNLDEVIKLADSRLYTSKKNGRNSITFE